MEDKQFLYSAYLKIWNDDVIDSLLDLGYRKSDFFNDKEPFIYVSDNKIYSTNIEDSNQYSYVYGYNCEKNIDMFIAIAAIRKDNDKSQWFVSDINGEFFVCYYDSIEDMRRIYINHMNSFILRDVHKASPNELRQYFIDKTKKSVDFKNIEVIQKKMSREDFLKECDEAACRYISYNCIEMSAEDAFGYIYDMMYGTEN